MKLVLSKLALALALAVVGANLAEAQPYDASGPEVPFPLSAQVPFPWTSVQGTWEASDEGKLVWFSFEVQNERSGSRLLRILRIDPATRAILATGAGLSTSEMLVRGIMQTAPAIDNRGRASQYILIVRAFMDDERLTMVLTERSLASPEADERHLVLARRVSAFPQKK